MIDQYDGVAVGYQILHDAGQSGDVGWMQPDGGFIQYVKHTGCPVADGACQLHALPFACGKRGRGTIQCQIAQSQIKQTFCGRIECFTDAFRHRLHGFRQAGRDGGYPFHQIRQGHPADFVKRDTAQFRYSGRFGKPRSATVGTGGFFQEFFDALHPFFVLDFGKGVFDGIDRVVIGEVQLASLIGAFGLVKDVFFLGRAVIDDFFFPVGQVAERYVGTDAHRATDIGHQRPHQGIPGRNRAIVDGETVIRHQCRQIDGPYHACSVTGAACALTVESQFLGGRCIKRDAAFGTAQRLSGGDSQRGFQIMPVRTTVICQSGKHQAKAVEQFGSRTEGAANAGNARTLAQCQSGGYIQHFIDLRSGGLRHPPPCIGRKRFQIAPRSFGIQDTQRQR